MSDGTWAKVTAKTAAEVCKLCTLGDEAKALARDGQTPKQFFDVLLEKQLHLDAIRLLAAALPKRGPVWWACLCARQAHGTNPPSKITAATAAAEKWVADPGEANRRAAQAAAEAAELGTPAGCAAMAA